MNHQDKISGDFAERETVRQAILSNDPGIYYLMAQIILSENSLYSHFKERQGNELTDKAVAETLIAFRRQLKHGKTDIEVNKGKILIVRQKISLADHLIRLFSLMADISIMNPEFQESQRFEKQLSGGQGFRKLYPLKDGISHILHTMGCNVSEDKEEIFHESLLLFWKKLVNRDVGIYFKGKTDRLDNCFVYNRKFYQTSRLSTFLTGIAKNLFLNRTKTAEYALVKNHDTELTEKETGQESHDTENPVLFMFLYFRMFVEERKLRSVVSLLQHDCNLEDKEVRMIIGINNARIHSSRLKNHFYQWYENNRRNAQNLIDYANDYYAQREFRREYLNRKIRAIDLYRRKLISNVDLGIFREEFRNVDEFTRYHEIFRHVFYFTSTGKLSSLRGLPDEKQMRHLMSVFKSGLYGLPHHQVIFLLLFYGTNEPESALIELIKGFHLELKELDGSSVTCRELEARLAISIPQEPSDLTNEVFKSNSTLFARLSAEESFMK